LRAKCIHADIAITNSFIMTVNKTNDNNHELTNLNYKITLQKHKIINGNINVLNANVLSGHSFQNFKLKYINTFWCSKCRNFILDPYQITYLFSLKSNEHVSCLYFQKNVRYWKVFVRCVLLYYK